MNNVTFEETYKRYSVWIYPNSNPIKVFIEPKQNCVSYWFQFFNFSYITWKEMQEQCVQTKDAIRQKVSFYNFSKLKKFFLSRMLRDTNYPILLKKDKDGYLTKDCYDELMRIHPRILRTLLNQLDLFNNQLSDDEEKRIAKQSALLFGKGNAVSNPHPHISMYCDLISFWQKFGLNYYDLQNLSHETYVILKRMMKFQSDFKMRETPSQPPKSPMPHARHPNRKMRF